jgi:hypothetical protein
MARIDTDKIQSHKKKHVFTTEIKVSSSQQAVDHRLRAEGSRQPSEPDGFGLKVVEPSLGGAERRTTANWPRTTDN